MKFGVRECCDVVLRAKAAQKIGNKIFYKNEPVCYFDTLKTSTLEGAATTVYAQGGRGNARLMSWDGERTVTFTMEDALISPIGLAILTGAGLIEATDEKPIIQHITETVVKPQGFNIAENSMLELQYVPHIDENDELNIYVMGLDSHGEVITEPYLFSAVSQVAEGDKTIKFVDIKTIIEKIPTDTTEAAEYLEKYKLTETGEDTKTYKPSAANAYFTLTEGFTNDYTPVSTSTELATKTGDVVVVTKVQNKTPSYYLANDNAAGTGQIIYKNSPNGADVYYSTTNGLNITKLNDCASFLVDYYRDVQSGAFEVDITPDKFGGSFYLEASTLWRDQGTGQDLPAEFIIPNCRVQSNFTFTMASSGDPSSFTFTMDAFPDYTRYDPREKVLARIQIIGATEEGLSDVSRTETWSKDIVDADGKISKPF